MELSIGQVAPFFSLKNEKNNVVSLDDFKGKWVVLYFYPKDDTPGCTRESIGFSENLALFSRKNAVILGVSKDSVDSHEAFCQKYDLKIPLLSDPEKSCIVSYGVWQEKKQYGNVFFGISRTTFLIGPDGKISYIWNNVKVEGHVDAVLRKIV